ncbi:MAG: hypothetical protein ABIQ06_02315 [Caldimonas sp.]
MFRSLLVVVLLLSGQACLADDDWFGGDKRAHFLGGVVVGGAFSAYTGSHHPGVLMGCSVGVFGELIEAARDRGFTPRVSAKDFAAECAGGVIGAWIGVKLASHDKVAAAKAARPDTDSWTSADKRAHFLGGFIASGLVSHYTDSATAGLLSGCGVAVAGELIDAAVNKGWNNKHVSAKDFAAGCLGGVAGAFAGVYIAPNRIVWSRQF